MSNYCHLSSAMSSYSNYSINININTSLQGEPSQDLVDFQSFHKVSDKLYPVFSSSIEEVPFFQGIEHRSAQEIASFVPCPLVPSTFAQVQGIIGFRSASFHRDFDLRVLREGSAARGRVSRMATS